jgi:hypothetical protein
MTEASSAVSLIVGSIVNTGKLHAEATFGAARFETLKANLAHAASAKMVISGSTINLNLIVSPHIHYMLETYWLAPTGRVVVVCMLSDSGGPEFLMHGKHPFHPDHVEEAASELSRFR